MQISTQTENNKQRKMLQLIWKMDLKFPNPDFNLLSIIAYILK